jgi:hypothetical protein
MTKIVNIKQNKCDIYIGRDNTSREHYGNPFSYNPAWGIECNSREDSITRYSLWLKGNYPDIEPKRREWILSHLEELKGKILGCFCKPLPCHGDVLIKLLKEQ